MNSLPLLSILVWLPIAGALAVLALGSGPRTLLAKQTALAVSVLTLLFSLPLWLEFETGTAAMQFVERLPWVERFGAYYYLGIDGISMPLIMLTTFLTPLVVLAGWEVIRTRPAQYFAAFLMLEGMMIGVFASLDAMLAPHLRHHQVLSLYLFRLGLHAGRADLYVSAAG